MAGKRNKIKKAAADIVSAMSPSPPPPPADDGLLDDLLAQLDKKDSVNLQETAQVLREVEDAEGQPLSPPPKKGSRSRHDARKARKAAELAASYQPSDPEADAKLQKEKEVEEATIRHVCDSLGLEMYEINPDGHCLYSAIADQLALIGLIHSRDAHYQTTRDAAASYMINHQDEFLPFLPSLDGEDGIGATESTGLMEPADYVKYCSIVKNTGAWGGEPEIMALAQAFKIPIHVVQTGSPPVVVHNPIGVDSNLLPKVMISYHRRMYGLGEHYNSLRPKRGVMNAL